MTFHPQIWWEGMIIHFIVEMATSFCLKPPLSICQKTYHASCQLWIINLKGSWGETVEKCFIFKVLSVIYFLSRVELCSGVLFLFLKFIYLFIFGCVGSSLLCPGFLQLRRAGATLCCGTRASHCGGFSCCGARALGMWASVVVECGLSSCGSRALERRLSSCGARAQLLHGMWDLPGPGLEPVSPALAGRFLTTVPPGKSQESFFVSLFSPNFIPRAFQIFLTFFSSFQLS